jgi:hypothetical protein
LNKTAPSVTNYLVKQSPITRAARAMLSLLAVVAWLHAANHCAIAGMLSAAVNASAEQEPSCPNHKAPAEDEKSDGCDASSCCKSLAAPVALTKVATNHETLSFLAIDFHVAAGFEPGEQHLATIAEIDTGPPDCVSFAESVLQRSLLAHAPPSSLV